ncbi:hypothetical protein CH373_15535 [Leptospira perolatii]|uniref:DUF2339 domain-containing protein n=1 Tax=Leptospira perolatii TaxID=2023191 RepID=A0A2M9ZJB4_9LEPT|nr:DUF2339 domain-containing protein [Leptospira perolatii]PJZ68826.1 hypothetical protein CH360_13995 [Leptospira perolatii]PJZ72157.1 hypothetical protein CH373_15535 [Leptospira perolatii]
MELEKVLARLEELQEEIVSLKKEVLQFLKQEESIQAEPKAIQTTLKEKEQIWTGPVQKIRAKVKGPEWEFFLGGNVLGKAGLVAILLASIWFIKYAFDNRWVNESGRILIGIAIGSLISFFGLQLFKKRYRVLPESVTGTGFSVLYLSIFAAYYYYDLFSLSETFLYLIVLSLFSSGLAYWIRKEILYVFGLLGSLFSPVLISQGENSYKFLFLYLLFINVVFFAIGRKLPWRVSSFLLLLSNFILYSFWAFENLRKSSFEIPFLFIVLTYFLFIYRDFFIFPNLQDRVDQSGAIFPRLNWIFLPIFTLVNHISYGLMGYFQVETFHPNLTPHFYLVTAAALAVLLDFYKNRDLSVSFPGKNVFELMSLYFLCGFTLAGLTDFSEGYWLTLSWIASAGVVSILSAQVQRLHVKILSVLLWVLALYRLYFETELEDLDRLFLLNERFSLYFFASLLLLGSYYIRKKETTSMFDIVLVYVGIFTLILGTLVDVRYTVKDEHYRNLSYSYVLGVYSFCFLFSGFKYSFKSFRVTGIVITSVLVLKLYFYDIWTMSLLVRIIAGFSLGAALVLTSLFYQKFRDKISFSRNIGSPLLILGFSAYLFGSPSLYAEEINTKGYKYYKDIKTAEIKSPKEKTDSDGIYYRKIKLDEDIVRHSGVNDRRVVLNGRAVPFFSRGTVEEVNQGGEVGAKLLFKKKNPANQSFNYTYVLKLPNLPPKTKYTAILAEGLGEYEVRGQISLGKSPEHWRYDSTFTIYRYSGNDELNQSNQIRFETQEETYVRIEVTSDLDLKFSKAVYSPISERVEFKRTIERSEIETGYDSDTKSSIYYFRNPMKVPIHRMLLFIKEDKFERKVEVSSKSDSKKFEWVAEQMIFRKGKNDSNVNLVFSNPLSSEIKLEIAEGDDSPLTLEKIEVFILQEEIVFPLKQEELESAKDLKIFYGNPYAFPPQFDFASTLPENIIENNATLGSEKENENFGYSIGEPPVSTWIIRVCFFAALGVLAWFTYRIFVKLRNEDSSQKIGSPLD